MRVWFLPIPIAVMQLFSSDMISIDLKIELTTKTRKQLYTQLFLPCYSTYGKHYFVLSFNNYRRYALSI